MSKQCRGGDAMGIRSIKEAVLLEGWRYGGKGKGEENHMEKRCFRENGMGMGGERGQRGTGSKVQCRGVLEE